MNLRHPVPLPLAWLLATVAVAGAFVLPAFATLLVGLGTPSAGAITAFIVVATAYWTAPRAKPLAALVALLIGGALAWYLLAWSVYPENHPKAYQRTHLPLLATWAGGIVSCALHLLLAHRRRSADADTLRA